MSAEGWTKFKLDDLIIKRNQGVNTTTEKVNYSENGIPVIRAKNVTNTGLDFGDITYVDIQTFKRIREECKPQLHDILYTNIGSQFGTACLINTNTPFLIAWNVMRIQVDNKLDPSFLKYLLNNPEMKSMVRGMNSSSTMPFVSGKEIGNLDIYVPHLPTQIRIATILSALDGKIELNRQTNTTLETIAQATFKEWFVDFRFPGATGEMQNSELGPIPKGWKIGNLRDICELNPRLTLKKGSVAKYVEMKNLSQSLLSIEEPRNREFTSGSKFQKGDTLLARITPCLENGKTGFVDFLNENETGWGSTEFIVLRGKECVNPYFIYCLSRLPAFREFAIRSMVGSSGRQRVVVSILSDYPMAVPDHGTVDKFFELMKNLFFQMKINSDQSSVLIKTRDTLLPKLMSGEVEV